MNRFQNQVQVAIEHTRKAKAIGENEKEDWRTSHIMDCAEYWLETIRGGEKALKDLGGER